MTPTLARRQRIDPAQGRKLRPRDVLAMFGPRPPVAEEDGPRVFLAGKLDALAAPGGGETQLAEMARWLPRVGCRARIWRPWEDELVAGDIVHLFGSLPEFERLAIGLTSRGVRVVVSPITWFDLASCLREPLPVWKRARGAAAFVARVAWPRTQSWRRRLYHSASLLMPNSNAEAEQLARYFGVPSDRLFVVPNAAEERFAQADPGPFARLAEGRGFVLYSGRIEPRKNQLGFLRAMRDVDVPIVILGDPVPGHESYHEACRLAAGPHVRFIGRIAHDDPLLASAYAACGCLVLASWFETPGLVALEAGMSGVPLVLPRGGCAREYFGELAAYVSPGDLEGIREATLAALAKGRNAELARHVAARFTWRAAAEISQRGYARLADGSRLQRRKHQRDDRAAGTWSRP